MPVAVPRAPGAARGRLGFCAHDTIRRGRGRPGGGGGGAPPPISQTEAAGIAEALQCIHGVVRASVAPANGSVLIIYAPGDDAARAHAFEYLDGLDALALPKGDLHADASLVSENSGFYRDIATMVLRRSAVRMLMPPQLGAAITIIRAIPFVIGGIRSVLGGRFTVEALDAAAVAVALLQRNFASAANIMFLLGISDTLQRHVSARTRIALQESLITRAETVWMVCEDGTDAEVQLADLEIGDMIHVRSGQAVPVDGTVVSGDASVNEAAMTGEATSVEKHEGTKVFAGTVCEEGSLVVRTDALAGSSRMDQIVRLVEESSELKARVQGKAERLADSLVPASLSTFLATLGLTRDIARASSVLMVDFSCAIKLSTPVSVMSAMREASDLGAIVKGGKYLEALANADVIVFDKTGTLTTAAPKVERIITFNGMKEREALRLAACLEEHFPHSLARAIVQAAKDAGARHEDEVHAEVEYVVAHGIVSKVGRKRVCLGSAHFVFDDEGIPKPEGLDALLEREAPRASTVFLAVGNRLEAALCIADPLRPEAAGVLAQLRKAGIDYQVMLTGDSENCAQSVAAELGMDEYRAQALPEDKLRFVEELEAAGHTVVMVGDGINDSAALAAASVSVALNDASDIARAVADVSVMGSSLESLVVLRELSRRLMRRIRFGYRMIVGFNSALIVLGLVPVLSPNTAALLHNISTVAITAANTRRLLRSSDTPDT